MKKILCKLFLSVFACLILIFNCSASATPEINEVVSIDFLDNNYVFVFKTRCINIEGNSYQIGARDAMSFENSEEGRALLEENLPEPYLSAVLDVWNGSEVTDEDALKSKNRVQTSNITEVITINYLDNYSVTFSKFKHIIIEDVDCTLGDPTLSHYENSLKGRESVAEEIPEPYLSAVMAVWGDTPTVIIPEEKAETVIEETFG